MEINTELHNLIDEINIISNYELNNIKIEVDLIIKNRVINTNTIEKLFDRMLSLISVDDKILKSIYFKLLDYYKIINEDYSKEYEKFYLEKFEEEKVLKKIK